MYYNIRTSCAQRKLVEGQDGGLRREVSPVATGGVVRFLLTMLRLVADTLVLYLAASLSKPMQPMLDAYSARTGTVIQRESGASLEHIRKVTELHRVPDLMLLADAEVIPQLLVPKYATWYAEFARNRLVVAYTARSKHASEINAGNWMAMLQRSDVEVGRTDPNLAPAGYRTLLLFQLAERYYKRPGLAAALLRHAPGRTFAQTPRSSPRCSRPVSSITSSTINPSPSRTGFDI